MNRTIQVGQAPDRNREDVIQAARALMYPEALLDLYASITTHKPVASPIAPVATNQSSGTDQK